MNKVGSVIARVLPSPPQSTLAGEVTKKEPVYQCAICRDAGYLYRASADGEAIIENGRNVLVRCSCYSKRDDPQRRARLRAMDGLNDEERSKRFDSIIRTPDSARVIEAVESAVGQRRGLITLTGKPGTGKSTILQCAVNMAIEQNVSAVYTTVTDLLDYLRAAFAPGADLEFDTRWDTLVRAEVLALDELDEFNTTPWAMERFLRLIDERWRSMTDHLTICATNSSLNAMPAKISSRLRDGRALVLQTSGPDFRPYQQWQ